MKKRKAPKKAAAKKRAAMFKTTKAGQTPRKKGLRDYHGNPYPARSA